MENGSIAAGVLPTRRRWRRVWLALCLSLGLFLLGGAARGQAPDDWQASLDRLAEETLPRLEEHATWCQGEKLYGERDRTYEQILLFDPEHAAARKYLKYKKLRGGGWEQSRSYKQPKDRDPELLPECAKKRAEALEPYLSFLIEGLKGAAAAPSDERRAWIEARLVELRPDDPRVREAFGEVWDELCEGWSLAETLRAAAFRSRLEEHTLTLLGEEGIAPQEAEPTDFEKQLGVGWASVLETANVRLLATGDPEQARQCCALAEATFQLLVEILGCSLKDNELIVYLLEDLDQQEAMLGAHPGLAAVDPAYATGRTGCWIPNSRQLVLWDGSDERTHNTVVEQAVRWILSRAYGPQCATGWAHEGLSLYLGLTLIGHDSRLEEHRPSWGPGEPVAILARRSWSRVSEIAIPDDELPVESTSFFLPAPEELEERFRGSLMMRYLIEACPEALPGIIGRLGKDATPPDEVVAAALGEELPAILERMLRWTRETETREEKISESER